MAAAAAPAAAVTAAGTKIVKNNNMINFSASECSPAISGQQARQEGASIFLEASPEGGVGVQGSPASGDTLGERPASARRAKKLGTGEARAEAAMSSLREVHEGKRDESRSSERSLASILTSGCSRVESDERGERGRLSSRD